MIIMLSQIPLVRLGHPNIFDLFKHNIHFTVTTVVNVSHFDLLDIINTNYMK